MYLAQLTIKNFRRIAEATLLFRPGLNVIVGPNNIGKTAVVDGLRALLAGVDDPYPRFTLDDIHLPKGGTASGEIRFEYVFRELSLDDEAEFLHALRVCDDGTTEAVMGVTYGDADKTGRLKPRRWCGEFNELAMTSAMLENLRSVYLQPLRDAELGLRPSRNSQLSRLLHLLSDEAGKGAIATALSNLDTSLRGHQPIVDTHAAITSRHSAMLGSKLAQTVNVGLAGTDFGKLAARLSLVVDDFEIERNGLGYNNLIFMAVVLSELAKNADAAFRSLIVEEPEAHLHPQLQAVLLRYLAEIDSKTGDEHPVQVFVTSHSPNFASTADLDSIICLVEAGGTATTFHPRTVPFEKGKREKLARYLDVTRAELFFARRALFVEGAAELLLVSVLARVLEYDLREHGVSLISVEGLNFDCFIPLFGENAIAIPVAVLTDADPSIKVPRPKTTADEKEKYDTVAVYPSLTDAIELSATAKSLQRMECSLVKVFHGQKTLEYDLALIAQNRPTMLAALKEIHPRIAEDLTAKVHNAAGEAEKAKVLFKGMFERDNGNVSKGRFAQALASQIQDNNLSITVPNYIHSAITYICQ